VKQLAGMSVCLFVCCPCRKHPGKELNLLAGMSVCLYVALVKSMLDKKVAQLAGMSVCLSVCMSVCCPCRKHAGKELNLLAGMSIATSLSIMIKSVRWNKVRLFTSKL
jgi:hypothetical protein